MDFEKLGIAILLDTKPATVTLNDPCRSSEVTHISGGKSSNFFWAILQPRFRQPEGTSMSQGRPWCHPTGMMSGGDFCAITLSVYLRFLALSKIPVYVFVRRGWIRSWINNSTTRVASHDLSAIHTITSCLGKEHPNGAPKSIGPVGEDRTIAGWFSSRSYPPGEQMALFISGWWFGCHFFIFPWILGCFHHPNWRTHFFQRGG